MDSFFQQILTLLTTSPGNLAYHLVLAFSVASAMVATLNIWLATRMTPARRTLIGLGLLLLAQFLLIIWSGLAQIYPDLAAAMPSVDRAVTAFSLVLLIWLWVFPDPLRQADFGTALLGVLVLTLAIFSSIWWINQSLYTSFNGSPADLLWTGFSMLLAAAGFLFLIFRRPPGYGTGLAMFVLLFIGELVHFLAPASVGDYPGAVRLAQMVAYPILLFLPQRYPLPTLTVSRQTVLYSQATPGLRIQPALFQAFLSLATKTEPLQICQAMSLTTAHALSADICLLVSIQNNSTLVSINCGYNLNRQEFLGAATFDRSLAPVIAESLRQNRPLHIPAKSNLPDLRGLGNALNLLPAGPLLSAPIQSPASTSAISLILLSLQANHVWTAEDQNYLADIARTFSEVFRRAQSEKLREDQLTQANRALNNLQAENERLSLAARTPSPAEKSISPEVERLQAELRLTMKEVALLRNALQVSDQKLPTLEKMRAGSSAPES
jgi:GAF domain-containing protein